MESLLLSSGYRVKNYRFKVANWIEIEEKEKQVGGLENEHPHSTFDELLLGLHEMYKKKDGRGSSMIGSYYEKICWSLKSHILNLVNDAPRPKYQQFTHSVIMDGIILRGMTSIH